MLKRSVVVVIASLMVFALAAPSRAERIRLYPTDFGIFQPELLGALNLLLQGTEDLQVPIDEQFDLDWGFCDFLGVDIQADIFFDIDQSGFSLFWDTSGDNDIFFQAVFQEWSFTGDIDFVADNCIEFISFDIDLLAGDIGSTPNYADMVLVPYLNTETGFVELDFKDYSGYPGYQVVMDNFHLDLGLPWPLDDLLEPLLEGWAHSEIEGFVEEALVGENGALKEAILLTVAGLYELHKMCGCSISVGNLAYGEAFGFGQVLANLGVYLLPALVMVGLKRRSRKK